MQIETKYHIGQKVVAHIAKSSSKKCECCGQEIIDVKQQEVEGVITEIRLNGWNTHYAVTFDGTTYILSELKLEAVEESKDEC